jgi:hypothetical protein
MLRCAVPCCQAVNDLKAAGKSEKEINAFSTLFKEVQQQIDSKQLRPFIRTQYMRTAFQVGASGLHRGCAGRAHAALCVMLICITTASGVSRPRPLAALPASHPLPAS